MYPTCAWLGAASGACHSAQDRVCAPLRLGVGVNGYLRPMDFEYTFRRATLLA